MSDQSFSVFDGTNSDPDFFIDGMNSDSSVSVSDIDKDTYRILIENDQKANSNDYSSTSTY